MSQRLSLLESMLAKGSVDPFVWYAHAMELRAVGRKGDALQRFQEVRATFPDYVPTYLMAGQLAEELGQSPLAREYYEAGIAVARARGDGHALSELDAALAQLE